MSLDNILIEDELPVKTSQTETTPGIRNLNSLVDEGFDVIEDESADKAVVLKAPEDGRALNNDVPNERLFEAPIVEQELPKFTAEFEIQADKVNTLTDVLKIQNDITERGTISTEDIAQIDSIIPGFVNEENPIEQYTQLPSKTNLQEGLNDIDTALEKQYDDLRLSIKELTENYLKRNSGIAEQINKKFVASISALNKAHAELLFYSEKEGIENICFILNNGMRWNKFLNTSITGTDTISSDDASTNPFDNTFVATYINKIKEVDSDSSVINTIDKLITSSGSAICFGRDFYEFTNDGLKEYSITEYDKKFGYMCSWPSYGKLYDVLGGVMIREVITGLINVVASNIGKITETASLSAQAQEQDEPIIEKIKQLTLVSALINKATQENRKAITFLNALFDLYFIYTDMTKQLAEKQKPVQ